MSGEGIEYYEHELTADNYADADVKTYQQAIIAKPNHVITNLPVQQPSVEFEGYFNEDSEWIQGTQYYDVFEPYKNGSLKALIDIEEKSDDTKTPFGKVMYTGSFDDSDNAFNGDGVFYSLDGYKYIGKFYGGSLSNGKIYYPNGKIMYEDIKRDNSDSYAYQTGRCYDEDGNVIYEGEDAHNFMDSIIYPNGENSIFDASYSRDLYYEKASTNQSEEMTGSLSNTENQLISEGTEYTGPENSDMGSSQYQETISEDTTAEDPYSNNDSDENLYAAKADSYSIQEQLNEAESDPNAYLIPDVDKEYIDPELYRDVDTSTIRLAINEIYARHGRKFETPDLNAYFSSKTWYTPLYSASEFDDAVLNEYEKKNLETLASIRDSQQ